MKIFISYAKEDRGTVASIRPQLTDHVVYDWMDLSTTKSPSIVRDIEQNILRADAFLVVLSPSYAVSQWCEFERALAIHIDAQRGKDAPRFIHVLQSGNVPDHQELGLLRDSRRVDVDSLKVYVDGLAHELRARPEHTGNRLPQVIMPMFRNREEELQDLRNDLTNSGGRHFWLAVAPPQLGKSEFLRRLSQTMPDDWRTSTFELSKQSVDVRRSARRIVAALFGLDDDNEPDEKLAKAVATKINEGGKPHLSLIDQGELLDKRTIKDLRRLIERIQERIRGGRKTAVRLAVVVASRRQDFWGGVPPKPAFVLSLTEFQPHVIRETLDALAEADGREFSNVELQGMAEAIHQLTAGLPLLVSSTLEWLIRTQWTDLESLSSAELFNDIARPYINGQLFSLQSLFPQGGERQDARRLAIERAFQVLCPYRLITMSHLRRSIGMDEDFRATLQAAQWTEEDLLQALGMTALVLQTTPEPWHRIFPATRKIIFRLFIADTPEQARSHADARDFYELWSEDKSAGSEQGSIFIESIWHEVARLAIEQPDDLATQIVNYVRNNVETLNTSRFEATEMRSLAKRIFEADEDLQEALSWYPGLSDVIAEIIVGGASGEN